MWVVFSQAFREVSDRANHLAKLIERNLAKLAARTAPAQVLDKKAVEKAALMIPLYQARDALFQGTLRGLQ